MEAWYAALPHWTSFAYVYDNYKVVLGAVFSISFLLFHNSNNPRTLSALPAAFLTIRQKAPLYRQNQLRDGSH